MQNGRIRLTQLSASSSWDVNHGPRNGRLNFRRTGSRMGAWCARRKRSLPVLPGGLPSRHEGCEDCHTRTAGRSTVGHAIFCHVQSGWK